MSIKKTVAIATAVGALAAVAVPAMALENEFHGMYKFMGYQTNFFNGMTGGLSANPKEGFMAEQRARIQYTAKANADLKLVTHFELDSRFGGKDTATPYLGANNDAGNLDADQLTLETKNIYVDFNCPLTGANMKVGMQPWADSYQSLFLLADMTGVYATKGIGPVKASLGWFRYDDNTATAANVGRATADLFVLDGKFALNKDMTLGASYYNGQNATGLSANGAFEKMHMLGANADLNVGPASIKPFAAFQFGDKTATSDLKGFLLGAVTKTKIGSGAVNLSAIYLSGDSNAKNEKSFATVGANTTYFNAANMWLLVRNGQAINSSTSVLGNDMTVGGRGFMGAFAGYEAAMGKLFYNANIGYAQTAEKRAGEKSGIGTELNAQVGYKLFDNLSASAAFAYAILGDGLSSGTDSERFATSTTTRAGAANADDPYALNLQLSYTF